LTSFVICITLNKINVFSQQIIDSSFDQKFIHINVSVNDTNTYIEATNKYLLKAKKKLNKIFFEFAPYFNTSYVKLYQDYCTFNFSYDTFYIYLPTEIDSGETFLLEISYYGMSNSGHPYRGIINNKSDIYQTNVTWTLTQPFYTKHFIPVKPDLKDKFDSAYIFIIVDSNLTACSQGVLKDIVLLENGKKRYEWIHRYPIAFYLLSFAVSNYSLYNFKVYIDEIEDSLVVMNFLYNVPFCLENNKEKIDFTHQLITLFNKLFGPYPFYKEKYGHCMVPFPGGMENQTITSIGFFEDFLVAHELAHSWFGNNVTCATWQDIWFNEGFASYAEYLFREFLYDTTSALNTIKNFQKKAKNYPDGSVYIPFEELNNESRIFHNGLTYKKGACLVHMIRYLCNNDSLFFLALKNIQTNYSNSSITVDQVKKAFEEVCGIDLLNFFNEFYYGKGFPIYNIYWSHLFNDSTSINIKIYQRGSSPENNFFSIHLPFKVVFTNNEDTLIYLQPYDNESLFVLNFNEKVENLKYDPFEFILDSLESFSYDFVSLKKYEDLIKIYPNPSCLSYIIINLPDKKTFSHLKIFNSLLKSIKAYEINDNTLILDINDLEPGFYFLVFENYNNLNTDTYFKIYKKLIVCKN